MSLLRQDSSAHGIILIDCVYTCNHIDRMSSAHGIILIDCVYTCNHIDRMSSVHGIIFNCICPCSEGIQVLLGIIFNMLCKCFHSRQDSSADGIINIIPSALCRHPVCVKTKPN